MACGSTVLGLKLNLIFASLAGTSLSLVFGSRTLGVIAFGVPGRLIENFDVLSGCLGAATPAGAPCISMIVELLQTFVIT